MKIINIYKVLLIIVNVFTFYIIIILLVYMEASIKN